MGVELSAESRQRHNLECQLADVKQLHDDAMHDVQKSLMATVETSRQCDAKHQRRKQQLVKLRDERDQWRAVAQREAALRRKATAALNRAVDAEADSMLALVNEEISVYDQVARLESELDCSRNMARIAQQRYVENIERLQQRIRDVQAHIGKIPPEPLQGTPKSVDAAKPRGKREAA